MSYVQTVLNAVTLPGHARHEARQQRRQPEAEHAGREVAQEQRRHRQVVVELRTSGRVAHDLARAGADLDRDEAARLQRRAAPGDAARGDRHRRQQRGRARRLGRQRDQARQDHQEREEHLRERGDQRRAPRGRHRVGRHRALDDEEVGAPVAEREHEPQPHRDAEPVDAHRIGRRAAEPAPGVRERLRQRGARCRSSRPCRAARDSTSGTKPATIRKNCSTSL